MPPDKTLDDFQNDKMKIAELFERIRKKSKKEAEPSKTEQVVPTVVPTLSRLPEVDDTKRRIEEYLNTHANEHTVKDVVGGLKDEGMTISYENAKKTLQRLAKDNRIDRIKNGYWVTYKGKLTQKQVKIEELTSKAMQLETQLAESLELDKGKIPQVHKIIFVLNKKSVETAQERVGIEGDGSRVQELSTIPQTTQIETEKMLGVVLNPSHPDSIWSKWSKRASPNQTKKINGGIQESIKITEQTGFIGRMTVQIFENGGLWMGFDFSQHPIDLVRWREFEQWLTGIMQGRCDYGFLELTKYLSLGQFEWNIDGLLQKMEGDGKYCWTAKFLDDVVYTRLYKKEIDGKVVERREAGLEKDVPYLNWLQRAQAMIFGGVGMQFAVRQQHELEVFQHTVYESMNKQNNALQFLLKQNQQQMAMNERLLAEVTKKRERKVRVEQPQVKEETKVEAKPVVKEGTITNTKVCAKCGLKMWSAYMVCPQCNEQQG